MSADAIMNGLEPVREDEARDIVETFEQTVEDSTAWQRAFGHRIERYARTVLFLQQQIQRPMGLSELAVAVGMPPESSIEEIHGEMKGVYEQISEVYAKNAKANQDLEAERRNHEETMRNLAGVRDDYAQERALVDELMHAQGHTLALFHMLCRMVAQDRFDAATVLVEDILGDGDEDPMVVLREKHGIRMTGWPIELLAEGMSHMLRSNKAVNYGEFQVTTFDPETGEPEKLLLTAQWQDGKSPNELCKEAEAEVAALQAQVRELTEKLAQQTR